MQPGLGSGTSPVSVASVLCPLPGLLSEGEIFLEHLMGDAVALRGLALFPRTLRTPQRGPLGYLSHSADQVPAPLSVKW